MSRATISFDTSDHVTLRGWFYKPVDPQPKVACLVMAHGFSALKEMDLDKFAEYFTSHLQISCLVYDHRGFGESDHKDGHPRQEIIPYQQISDFSDAITYAQSRNDVNPEKIGIWGSSLSGGHVLWLGAADRRVKAVLSQVPAVDGWANYHRMVRPDFGPVMNRLFEKDRMARAAGMQPETIPVVNEDANGTSAIPSSDSYEFFSSWAKKSNWKNVVTLKSIEANRDYFPSAHIHRISPTPLLMTVATEDVVTPTDLELQAYRRALEPKQLNIIPGGHFDAYAGPNFQDNAAVQAEFLKKWLE